MVTRQWPHLPPQRDGEQTQSCNTSSHASTCNQVTNERPSDMPKNSSFVQKTMEFFAPQRQPQSPQNEPHANSNAGHNSKKAKDFLRGLNCSKCNEPLGQLPTLCPACGAHMT
ncbi:hypothetical protein AB1N83_001897 [Pleurotus pulmonarius]